MQLLPTPVEILDLARQTGALREGHFESADGLHRDRDVEITLLLRDFTHNKLLSVALSRRLRSDPDIRVHIPELSLVAVSPAGVPVACGLCESLQAFQVYWVDKAPQSGRYTFRPNFEPFAHEKVILVDAWNSGKGLIAARALVESYDANVLACAVLICERAGARLFDPVPVFSLANLEIRDSDPTDCDLCRRGVPLTRQSENIRGRQMMAARH